MHTQHLIPYPLLLVASVWAAACSEPPEPSDLDGSTGSGSAASTTDTAPSDSAPSDSAPPPGGTAAGESTTTGPDGSTGSDSADDTSTGSPEPVEFEGLQACLEDLAAAPGLSATAAAVVVDDEIVWAGGFGERSPGEGGVVDENTRFRVASVTKMMTAIAALSLSDDGALDLDAPLGDSFPAYGDPSRPEWTASLDVRRLLSHQGGLYDYITIDGPREDAALSEAVLGELFSQVPFLVEPGALWNYSNANYSVAGLAVERSAESPYREVIAQRLFSPLQMERSTFDVDEVDADDNYARGVSGAERYGATDYDNAWARPAGFAWSSAADLGRLARFLARGDEAVLSDAAHATLVTPQLDTQLLLDRIHYGLGLFHADFIPGDGGFIEISNFDHGGNLPGYTSLVHVIPDHDFAIAIASNGDNQNLYPCVVAALSDLPGPQLDVVQPDTAAEQTELDDYEGSYTEPALITGDFTIEVTPEGLEISFPELDALDIPYEPALRLFARDNFLVNIQGIDLQLTGIRDDDGALRYLRSRAFVGQLELEPAPPAAVRPMVMDPDVTRRTLERLRRDQPARLTATMAAIRAR